MNKSRLFFAVSLTDITADKQQVLYRSCIATEQDVPGRCSKVVTDILSEKGLCPLHLAVDSEVGHMFLCNKLQAQS